MQFVSYQSPTGPRAALALDGKYIDVNAADSSLPVTLKELVGLGLAVDLLRGEARPMAIEYALSNGFGFGGVNASVLFKRWQG